MEQNIDINLPDSSEIVATPSEDDLDVEIAQLEDVSTRTEPPLQEEKAPAEASPVKPSVSRKAKSPYFQSPPPTPKKRRPAANTVSALPIPPLSAPDFGLIQESLAAEPFRLLIAVTFLIKTAGRSAIPAFQQLMEQYPTPEALAAADPGDITARIRHLGLGAVRCAAIQRYARRWIAKPPSREVRFAVKNYPRPGDGADVRAGQEFGREDAGLDVHDVDDSDGDDSCLLLLSRGRGSAWEIGHITQGRYALDSWRIFCRDVLVGKADDWKGGGREAEFQPEWMRVLPEDKELRACLRWMWMREGWEWDPVTGEREVLREELRKAVDEGRVGYDDAGGLRIEDDDSVEER